MGTNSLEVSIGRDLGALQGLRLFKLGCPPNFPQLRGQLKCVRLHTREDFSSLCPAAHKLYSPLLWERWLPRLRDDADAMWLKLTQGEPEPFLPRPSSREIKRNKAHGDRSLLLASVPKTAQEPEQILHRFFSQEQ